MKDSSWNSYKTKFDVLVDTKFTQDETNWIWYGIAHKERLVVISLNKNTAIEEDEIKLVQFMINNLIIN